MSDYLMEGMGDYLLSGIYDQILNGILEAASRLLPIILLIMIPGLVWACVNCFFGYRIFRIVLVIRGVLTGGIFGVLLGGMFGGHETAVLIVCFLIGAVAGGLINWYLYMIGVFLQGFGAGFGLMLILVFLISKNVVAALLLGITAGIAVGVVSCIFVIPAMIIVTGYNGGTAIGGMLAMIVMILSKNLDAYKPTQIIVSLLFVAGGIAFQYLYEKKRGTIIFSNAKPMPYQQSYQQPIQQPYQQPVQEQQYAPVQNVAPMQPISGRVCQLIGMEGMYKGFEFDVDSDIRIGRDEEQCNIIFPKETQGISRIQCQITLNPERTKAFIVDNHSSYGTKLNGEKLEYGKMKALNNGDIIHFGEDNIFKIQY